MCPKKYLQQIKKCEDQIDNKIAEVSKLREMATSITSTLKEDVVQTSGSGDKLGEAVSKILDLENEINAEIDKLVDIKKEIMGVIDALNEPHSTLLYKRYFQFKKWEEIAIEMNYSYRQITRMHGRALQKVSEFLLCEV